MSSQIAFISIALFLRFNSKRKLDNFSRHQSQSPSDKMHFFHVYQHVFLCQPTYHHNDNRQSKTQSYIIFCIQLRFPDKKQNCFKGEMNEQNAEKDVFVQRNIFIGILYSVWNMTIIVFIWKKSSLLFLHNILYVF